jgi:hypothetical protein
VLAPTLSEIKLRQRTRNISRTVQALSPTVEPLFDVGLDFSSLGGDDPDTSKSPDRQKCFPERKSMNLIIEVGNVREKDWDEIGHFGATAITKEDDQMGCN